MIGNMRKRKVINIMPHPPAYDFYSTEPRPAVNWDTPDGQWVGIWGADWLDQIGREVLARTREYSFEVWQPDLRADRIYSHTFPDGLVHKLFPAVQKYHNYGFRQRSRLCSSAMKAGVIEEVRKNQIILRVGAMDWGVGGDVLRMVMTERVPMIAQFWGEFVSPLRSLYRLQRNMPQKFYDVCDHFLLRRLFRRVDCCTHSDDKSRKDIRYYAKDRMISLSVGIDFDFWKRHLDKNAARERSGIDRDKKVILSSSRWVDTKQIDRVISILNEMEGDFLFAVTGHGDDDYRRYLMRRGEHLMSSRRLKFFGYVGDAQLRDLYAASDLFVMSSLSEAGPVATIKALAMEVPVLSTDTGQMAELMVKYGAGVIVPKTNYKVWEREFREIICGKEVSVLDRDIVKKIHHWPYVARQYVEIYDMLCEKYYGDNQRKEGVHEGC